MAITCELGQKSQAEVSCRRKGAILVMSPIHVYSLIQNCPHPHLYSTYFLSAPLTLDRTLSKIQESWDSQRGFLWLCHWFHWRSGSSPDPLCPAPHPLCRSWRSSSAWLSVPQVLLISPHVRMGYETSAAKVVKLRQDKIGEFRVVWLLRELYSVSCDKPFLMEKNMKENIYICITESLCCTAEINTTL